MKHEAALFRTMLLVLFTSLVGFGSLAIYFDRQSSNWAKSLERSGDYAIKAKIQCENALAQGLLQPPSCDLVQSFLDERKEAEETTHALIDKAELFTTLTWSVPLFCVVSFYGGRWAISGRIKPLWPINSTEKS
jgi:hypothetical protein